MIKGWRVMVSKLLELLNVSAAQHSHLCPRQVLGVRIGLAGMAALAPSMNDKPRRLLVILEMDGCFVDGISAATGCCAGKRSLRIEDFGKVAATFVDVKNEHAVRIAPQLDVRQRAQSYAPGESRHYFAQLHGYQVMPDEELLTIQPVQLTPGVTEIISRAGVRVNCTSCGEEIINEREVRQAGQVLCRACAGQSYYVTLNKFSSPLQRRAGCDWRRSPSPDLEPAAAGRGLANSLVPV